jgi:2-dehydropantoate 2-reductase
VTGALHWHVLGAGAMGCMLAHRLQGSGQDATLLHHRRGRERRQLIAGEQRLQLNALPLQDLAPGSIRYLVLTTKAGTLVTALEAALPHLAAGAVVLTTANGLGFETALTRLRAGPVHRAVSTAAAYRDDRGAVHIVSTGQTRLGTPGRNEAAPNWFVDSLARLDGWSWERDIEIAIGEKFSLNCVINALTAVRRCRNGELLQDDAADAELTALCAECEPVLRSLKLWQRPDSLLSAAVAVCRSTAGNQSSMLQDVLAGRPTEIAFLNGELLRRAKSLGLSMPNNRMLVAALDATARRPGN